MTHELIESIGFVASAIILASMLFRTTTLKGTLLMRGINSIGSLIFLIYGILLPAIATAVMNGIVLVINLIYLQVEYVHAKKKDKLKRILEEVEEELS